MAPTAPRTRSQRAGKQLVRKSRAAPKGTEVVPRDDSDIENEDPHEPQPLAIENTLEHLHTMTAGLEREIELFAERLDQFLEDLQPGPAEHYDTAHDMVLEFKSLAVAEASALEADHGQERREQLAREWIAQANISTRSETSTRGPLHPRAAPPQTGLSKPAQELRMHQDEAHTWELFRIMLEQHCNPNTQQLRSEKESDLNKLGPIHRYSPESDLYQQFTISDDLARERHLIRSWLEQSRQLDVGYLTHEMEQRADEKIYWGKGWMHTREKLKGEKRLRVWPAPDVQPLPQLRSTTNDLLVTTLDPDATSRQRRSLEKQDAHYEQALWTACWEMLRRGTSWVEICEWTDKHHESWRSALLGRGLVSSDSVSLVAWRKACFDASHSKCSCDHEAAVYGLFSGNVSAMEKVCHTVDDRLYAHYSAALVQHFDQYIAAQYPDRIAPALQHALGENTADAAQSAIMDLIKQLKVRSDTKTESLEPLKIIQAYLLANDAQSLVHTVGSTIGQAQGLAVRTSTIDVGETSPLPEAVIAKDPTGLLMVAHIAITLQLLRSTRLEGQEAVNEDNVIGAYIRELATLGKRDLTPAYAARMTSSERRYTAMAIVCEAVTEVKERQELASLMTQKRIHAGTVLWYLMENVLADVIKQSPNGKPVSILEYTTEEPDLYPGQRINLKADPDVATSADEDLVRHLEWFLCIPKEWEVTFHALTTALRKVLVNGRFACARLIIETFKSVPICESKTYQILGRSINLFAPESLPAAQNEADQWALMERQAQTYQQLEQLVNVYEALFTWRKQEQRYAHANPRSPAVPKELKESFAALSNAMEPLLDPHGFLLNTMDDAEEEDIAVIRRAYVTDAIVAYNTVLYGAGRLISRDMLLRSMDLSTIVAKESTQLTDTFMQAGRLQELVTSFAFSSKAILIMKGTGKPWKPRYERRQSKDVNIWDVPLQKSTGNELTML